MAFPSADCRTTTDRRATRLACSAPLPSGNAAATIIIPAVCSAISCCTATPDSRSRRSPAWSASAGPTASHQQGVSSKEAIQAAHHRMAGRPHGKLLPRYAGPIAEFILTHADATRYDVLDFIERTWGVRVSTVALHHFCKKFGLDRATRCRPRHPDPAPSSRRPAANGRASPRRAEQLPAEPCRLDAVPPSQPVPLPPPPFSRRRRRPSTRGPSC